MDSLIHRPKLSLVLLTGICLFVFWLSIPLPRIDNQLVGSDGVYYYVFLPSFWLDRDLDFTDEYTYFFPGRDLSAYRLPPNKYTVGVPLLWSPFFVLAHLSVWLCNTLMRMDIAMDGYGYVYQAFALSGSIVYGGLALWLTYKFVNRASKQSAALIATVLTVFGGNLIYYLVAEPSMSHALSAFCSSWFFLTWSNRRQRSDLETSVLYGLLAGLMALIRPQDGVFLILPFLSQLPDVWQSIQKSDERWRIWLRNGFVAGIVALVVFSPQFVVWHHLYGGFLRTGYSGEDFYWFTPKLGAVLFSAQRGLFAWHPIFLLSVLGLCLQYKRDKALSVIGLCGFAIQWYIISSWHSWYQGDAFGGRMFIVCMPMFALGLAYFTEYIERRLPSFAVYAAGAVLLFWNFLLFVEYRFDLVLRDALPTWYDLTIGRFTFLADVIRRFL